MRFDSYRARIWTVLVGLTALALSRGLVADESAPSTAVTPPSHKIELIVFRYVGADGGSARMGASQSPVDTHALPQLPASGGQYTALPRESLRLGGVVAKLQRNRLYQPLLHYGWPQPLVKENAPRPVPLPAEAGAQGLSGSATVYRGRYLHVMLDLELRTSGQDAAGNQAVAFHLRQSRRVKSGTLQYFDNPGFGAIVVVRAPAGADVSAPAMPGAMPAEGGD